MEKYSTIQTVLDYIEDNMEACLDSDTLAEIGFLSKSHFFKLFTLHTGYTPMNCVLRRKLQYAAKRIIACKEKIADIAFQFGFESHDVFSRAFKRVYGITPESYRKRGYTLHEMKKVVVDNKNEGGKEKVDVQIVERPSMCFLGVERQIGHRDGEATIAHVWEQYFQNYQHLFGNVINRVKPEEDAEYALAVFDHDGKLSYFVGFEVEDLENTPAGAVGRKVPALTYAKATHVGLPAETLGQTLDYVYGEWFANNVYRTAHLCDSPYSVIEYYDRRCSLTPPEMDIYVPIKSPSENKIEIVPSFEAVYYRAVGNNLAKLKYEAFDVMINWVEKNGFANDTSFKLGVKYGETDDHESFCEIFYKLTKAKAMFINSDKVKLKTYVGGTYAVAPGVHHFLEKDWASFVRWLEQHSEYKPVGGCYEEFLIKSGKVDYYTNIQLYERVEKR
ncbi:effector binding domain-containing protein [Paenibacillus septentrionalis]|uniref:Effector binding domain-containing protein n=1 Tax=Paenibacillus septentrionalis TaxID=429342 RepID=A0ABW1UXX1_9BACL